MRHFHSGHHHCRTARGEHEDGLSGGRGQHRGGGRGGARVFGHGGLRFVLLQLIADKPAHGYELIKAIEDRLGGSYAPSPGVVYPTLTLLEELGHLSVESGAEGGGRKRYSITASGQEFLAANREMADAMMARMSGGVDGAGPRGGRPPQVTRAIENLKLAMRMRLSGVLTEQQAHDFAAVLDSAAQQIEKI